MRRLILFLVFSASTILISASHLSPVILVPGLLASHLESKVAPPTLDDLFNNGLISYLFQWLLSQAHTFLVWLNVFLFFPGLDTRYIKLLELNYNNVTRKTTDLPGYETIVEGFGDPHFVEYLVDCNRGLENFINHIKYLRYFSNFAHSLESMGYKRNESLRAAPYDFRKAPNESQEYYKKLKNLVEETYTMNGNRKTVFVTHSYGGPMIISFLRMQPKEWKDKYIRSMISISAPFGGTSKAIYEDVTGDELGTMFPLLNKYYRDDIKTLVRTWPSMAFLMPNAKLWENRVLVRGPQKNYTMSNINEFFDDLGNPNILEMLKDQQRELSLEPPDVEYHCLYSTTDKDITAEMLTYSAQSEYPGNPTPIHGPGDGTVNLRSLEYCKEWTKQQRTKVQVKQFKNLEHSSILSDSGVINYIKQILDGYVLEDNSQNNVDG